MHFLNKNNPVYSIDSNIDPILSVQPWEEITIELTNAFWKSFQTVKDFEAFMSPDNDEHKKAFNHPCAWPIRVLTQEENISLEIEILDIKATRGYQCISRSTWFLKDIFEERKCEIFDVDNGKIKIWEGDILLSWKPKLGFVSTVDQEVRSVGRCSKNWWNMDLNYLDKGSKIYLTVNFNEPRVIFWDLHICQWNGEAAGMWIEADGEIRVKINIIDKIDVPFIDDKHRIIIVWWWEESEWAQRESVQNALIYLRRLFPFSDWNDEEIYKFISAEGNIVIWNGTWKVKTCWLVFYKSRILNKYSYKVFL